MAKIRLLGAGLATLDYVALVKKYPEANTKVEAVRSIVSGGGPVATALVAASRLGVETGFVTVLGTDAAGEQVLSELEKEGVNTEYIVRDPAVRTPRAFVWVDSSTGDRTVVLDNDRWRYVRADEVPPELPGSVEILLADGRDVAVTRALFAKARRSGVTTMLDCGSYRKDIEQVFPLVDYFVCSADYARSFTRETKPENMLEKLRRCLDGVVVVTLGDAGAVGCDTGGGIVRVPAYQTPVVDTTGAGDVFHGALCAAMLLGTSGNTLSAHLHFASAAAAVACSGLGGREKLPEIQDVHEMVHHGET